MSIRHPMCRAFRIGFGLSLVAAFALVNGCASGDVADESGQFDESSGGEASENLVSAPPPGFYKCRVSGGDVMGTLEAYPNGTCIHLNMVRIGSSEMYCTRVTPSGELICPYCSDLARYFTCAGWPPE